jgi:hypothetical protein
LSPYIRPLNAPHSPSSVPFAVFDGTHSNFDDFVAATTVGKTETLHLSGSANADAQTAVGLLSLTDISFSVDSDIAGLQGLDTKPVTVANLDVNHGFSDYLLIKVDSALFNPRCVGRSSYRFFPI